MGDRYNSHGPYVPAEPTFNERADRDSEEQAPIKPKNILAAIMGTATSVASIFVPDGAAPAPPPPA